MAEKKQGRSVVTQSIKKRMLITVGLMVCGFCVLIVSLVRVSILKHDEYSSLASSQQLRDTVITAPRGTIYDNNMNVLAMSATVWTVALSPKDIKESNEAAIAAKLSEVLEVDEQTILEKCKENNYYSVVRRKVDQHIVDEIRAWMAEEKIGGISFYEDAKRYYPYGNFLAQTLGFVGTDNQGLSGLEAYYDNYLSGTAGRTVTAKNAVGSDMYYEYETIHEAKAGYSLVLTIDEVIQHYLEKNLEAAIIEHNIRNNAYGVIMDVNTGAVYAMAVKPDFDPNDPFTILDEEAAAAIEAIDDGEERAKQLGLAQQKQWRNTVISDNYEPGSVFKVVTASTALETGAFNLNSSFYCPGSITVGPHTMSCATRAHGAEDFTHAVVNSCNVAFVTMGQGIGADDFCKFHEAFGLTEKTGIDLPGESKGDYIRRDNMGIVELSSCAFGQSNTVTALQLATAVAAAVNGGYLVQPHIVDQVIDADGNIVESNETQVKRQVISAETSATMARVLEQVVVEGNSQNAYVAGFRLGGKSGTAQDLKSNEEGKYWASFCAFAPADDPQIVCLVVYDNARSTSIFGGTIVAPVVASIMADVLPYIGVDAVYSEEELANLDVATPAVTGMSITQAKSWLQPEGLSSTVLGEGTTVVRQFPSSGQSIPRGSTVILYTDERDLITAVVPDVSGKTVSDATATLAAYGFNIKTSGSISTSATATSQTVAPGQELPTGSVVTVEFVDSTIGDF